MQIGAMLLCLAVLLGVSHLLSGVLTRMRIPKILGALLVGIAAQYTPLGQQILEPPRFEALKMLAELGVLFLLFVIGLEIDLRAIRSQRSEIVQLTLFSTACPLLLGFAGMLALGYAWPLALIIGVAIMPTAEAVIVPILDEFDLIRSRIGQLIIAAGILDDVIEVILVCGAVAWVSHATAAEPSSVVASIASVGGGLILLLLAAWCSARWIIPGVARRSPRKPGHAMTLTVVVLLTFGALAEWTGLGAVLGGLAAGVVMRPTLDHLGEVGEQVVHTIRTLAYGFLGMIFFLSAGLTVDLSAIASEPRLVLVLFLAAFLGKILGSLLMTATAARLPIRDSLLVGVGLNARLTTELVVAHILLSAGLIDAHLFTALAAVSAISTLAVPPMFIALLQRSRAPGFPTAD